MSYKTVFPRFGKLDIPLPEGFIDESAPERKMPTFIKVLNNKNRLRLWVDFTDKALSSFPNEPRFCLSVYNAAGEPLHDDIKTDRWPEAAIIIKGLEEYNTLHGTNR
jgi:hypothetical protein